MAIPSSSSPNRPLSPNETFKSLKAICIPLLSNSLLSAENIPKVSSLLFQLDTLLEVLHADTDNTNTATTTTPQSLLSPSTIEYIFFPISHLLRRNNMSSIPDVVMSKIMRVLTKLVDPPGGWWWMCTVEVWEQLVMFAGAIFCGLDLDVGSKTGASKDEKGKAKTQQVRDDETKRASADCLKALLRPRAVHNEEATTRNNLFKTRATQSTHLFSVLGQALTTLLSTSCSVNRTLRTLSFDLLDILVTAYFPSEFFPSILPGVVSAMTRITLGRTDGGSDKAWPPGESVKRALEIMQEVIVRAIGDEVCIAEGAVRTFSRLDELDGVQIDGEKILRPSSSSSFPPGPAAATATSPFHTKRTTVWLSSTSTHLTLAIKHTLTALTSHPTATALTALSTFSYALLSNTTQTLQELHPHLILTLLSCSTCSFPEIQLLAKNYLITLVSPSRNTSPALSHRLLQSLSTQAYQTLISLPHTIPTRSSTNLIKQANRIIAICNLSDSIPSISDGIAKLLGRGSMGGIEKWGWKFVEILRFEVPSVSVIDGAEGVTAFLEGGGRGYQGFHELNMRFVESKDAQYALDEMFRALGRAVRCARGRTGMPVEACSAVEWFVGLGRKKIRATSAHADEGREVAALWCAMRLLEGLRGVELDRREKDHSEADDDVQGSKDLEKTCRWIVKVLVELWEDDDDDDDGEPSNLDTHGHRYDVAEIDDRMPVQYIKGLNPLTTLFDIQKNTSSTTQHQHELKLENQIILQKILALRLLALTSSILHTPSSSSHFFLLHTLYPVLTSLTSQNAYLISTATSTLAHISHTTGYASPSNLLLANFDYALDGVGRKLRLSSYRSRNGKAFDPNAIAVLKILIRLVGRDIVSRASDVVEVCFERMEEFHGYGFVVEGVVGVLEEVIEAVCESVGVGVGMGEEHAKREGPDYMASFVEWYRERVRRQGEEGEEEDYGPAPREDWGKGKEKEKDPDESPPTDQHMSAHDEVPLTQTQQLTTQIISHSLNFLTHPSPTIRSRVLGLLSKVCTSVDSSEDGDGTTQSLPERAVLPIIHEAWPYILKRLDEKGDAERFVVFEAVEFVACLAETRGIGEFVASRIWKDVWPRVRGILSVGGGGKVKDKNLHPYSYSSEFRTYRAVLRLLTAVARGSGIQTWRNDVLWEVCLGVRRFLTDVNKELARLTRELYRALWKTEENDLVWLVLFGSCGRKLDPEEGEVTEVMWEKVGFLRESVDVEKWSEEECARNVVCI